MAAKKIRVGLPLPLSGIYGVDAHDQLHGAECAVLEFNQNFGDEWLAELIPKDTQLSSGLARELTGDLIHKDKAHVIVGALSAGDMLVISDVASQAGILYNAISQSDSILYRENRRRTTFHEGQNPHMAVGSIGRYAFSHYGSRVAFLNADAEFGQHSLRALLHVGEQIGVQVVENINYPVGSKDFRFFLERIRRSKPEVLVLNNFGDDQFLAVSQCREVGLMDEVRVICPNLSVTQRIRGGDVFSDVVGTVSYDWQLQKFYDSAASFNERYLKVSGGSMPTSYSAYGYNGVRTVLESIRLARSTETEFLVQQMEGLRYDFCKGPQFYRRLDHQALQCVVVVRSKPKKEMQSDRDIFEILDVIDFLGERAFLISRETL